MRNAAKELIFGAKYGATARRSAVRAPETVTIAQSDGLRRLLEGMRHLQNGGFVEMPAQNLQANW